MFDNILRVLDNDPGIHYHLQCFVDDTFLLIACNSADEFEIETYAAINAVLQFLQSNGLQLNADKTEFILFDRRRPTIRNQQPCDTITVGDTLVHRKRNITYLGVIIDDKLWWKTHLLHSIQKAKKYLPILTAVCHNTYGYSVWARRIMYKATVNAVIGYGSSLFVHKINLKEIVDELRKLHLQITRNIARLYKGTSYIASTVIADSMPLEIAIEARALTWLARRRTQYLEAEEVEAAVDRIQQIALNKWNEEWMSSDHGTWMRKFFPTIQDRQQLDIDEDLDFWVAQALSDKGCFGSFLCSINRRNHATCRCGYQQETAEHVLTACERFREGRPGTPLTPLNPDHINYLRSVIRQLWEEERLLPY